MPRFPNLHPTVAKLGGSVFSALTQRIAALQGEVYPLHVGDTWMEPDPLALWSSADDGGPDRPHRYTDPHGNRALLAAIVDKVRARNGLEISGPENVLVTAGATGALCAAALATVEPGDEVLLLAPYWPLMPGIVRDAGGEPVEVPLIPGELDGDTVVARLSEKVSDRTAAIYVNTPSNPSGRILPPPVLEAIAEFSRKHGIWIWSDEVYEQYSYVADHLCIATLAPERTLTVFSFSKAYGLAGYRCGYIVGPAAPLAGIRKVGTHVWYSVPTPAQLAVTRLLAGGDGWVAKAHASYRDTGYEAADRLGLPRPEGGTFLFFDVSHLLDERGLMGFLEDCLDDNLVLGPGPSFGPSFRGWTRLCFTCSPPDVVLRGVDKLAKRIGAAT